MFSCFRNKLLHWLGRATNLQERSLHKLVRRLNKAGINYRGNCIDRVDVLADDGSPICTVQVNPFGVWSTWEGQIQDRDALFILFIAAVRHHRLYPTTAGERDAKFDAQYLEPEDPE